MVSDRRAHGGPTHPAFVKRSTKARRSVRVPSLVRLLPPQVFQLRPRIFFGIRAPRVPPPWVGAWCWVTGCCCVQNGTARGHRPWVAGVC